MPISSLTGDRVYLDTNVFIYFVEGHQTHATVLRELFDAIDERAVTAITSELTLAEVLVRPLKYGRGDIVQMYQAMLSGSSGNQLAAVDRAVLLRGAAVRAQDGGRLFDAIHVATGLELGCNLFLTEDTRIRTPSAMPAVRLSELAALS